MHDIDLKTQMDIVYHSLNDASKGIIDVSCCGAFKRKSAEKIRTLGLLIESIINQHSIEHFNIFSLFIRFIAYFISKYLFSKLSCFDNSISI